MEEITRSVSLNISYSSVTFFPALPTIIRWDRKFGDARKSMNPSRQSMSIHQKSLILSERGVAERSSATIETF